MSETLVARLQTTCTPVDLYAALHQAWLACVQDAAPTREGLLTLLAHWALETGFGHSCWNWNLGNKKHVEGDGRDYYQVRCNEIIGGRTVWLLGDFIAFPDLETGAADYFDGLRGTFRAAWPSVEAGDPAGFCRALKIAHYYTADETIYTAGVMRCYHQLDAQIPIVEVNATETPEPHV